MTDTTELTEDSPQVYTVEDVQYELIEHLVELVHYWAEVDHSTAQSYSLAEKLSGMMHSFYVTFSGFSGGFNASINMYPFSTEEEVNRLNAAGRNFFPASADISDDINDGAMKYQLAENYVPAPNDSGSSREWTVEEMRALFFNKVADLYHEALAQDNLTEFEHGAYFFRSILDMFENGNGDFPKMLLLAVTAPEDKEYYIENGENYYDEQGTPLTGQKDSLTELWDAQWNKLANWR